MFIKKGPIYLALFYFYTVQLTQIIIYPLKGLPGIELPKAQISHRGLQFDRRYMLVDESGTFISQRTFPMLSLLKIDLLATGFKVHSANNLNGIILPFEIEGEPCQVKVWEDDCLAYQAPQKLSKWFSNELQTNCRLVYMPGFYLYYGQVLRSTGNYPQAKIAFDKYSALVPSDKSGKFFSNSLAIATEDHYWDEKITTSNISMLNTEEADFSPVIYKDGIVFTTSRKTTGHPKIYSWTGNNYLDLYYAKRGNNDTTFTEIEAFGGKDIVKKYHDGPASFSKNFDTIFTSRVEKDLKGEEKKSLNIERNKIYSATMENNSWSEPIPFPYNSKLYSVAHPFITKDGSRLYFVSNMPGGFGETDIYYCDRNGKTWGTPVNCGPNVNTFNREKYPSLDEFGNLYFSSDGYQGFGGADICVALNKNNKLEKAIPMKFPFNSTADDFGITFTKTGKAGYISSNRIPGGFGDDDILYFDLSKDAIDSTLVTSIYTMGYKPKPVKVIATPAEPLAQVIAPLVPKPVLVINNATPKPHGLMVFFDFDKSNIRKSEYAYLDSVVNYMKSSPSLKLIIGGYTDSKGTPAYNMNLSNQRNQSVLKYLSGKGISKSRMKATAYGLTNLLNYCVKERQCSNYESRINRRVELDFEFAPQN